MDKRGLKTSLVVSIVVMCILCIYLIFYITSQYEHNTNQNDNKIVENSNSADVLLLERYVDAFNSNCVDMKPFYTGKILISDIDSNIKLTTVLNMVNNYNKKYVENEYKVIFNEDIDVTKVTGTCPKISYDNSRLTKLDCTCKTKSGVVTKFVKSIKSEERVKLYYKVAFYSSKKYLGNESRMFSKDASGREVIDSRVLSKDIKEIEYQEYLNNNYNDFYTYIYTFKKNNGNYYFHSISKE